jgi:hypothetical protein
MQHQKTKEIELMKDKIIKFDEGKRVVNSDLRELYKKINNFDFNKYSENEE